MKGHYKRKTIQWFAGSFLLGGFAIYAALMARKLTSQPDIPLPSIPEASADSEVVDAQVKAVLEGKMCRLEDEILAELATCESGRIAEQDATIILDTNNRMSIGRYQWQRESITHYYKVLHNQSISGVEAIQIAIDKDRATELTRLVLFGTKNGYANWLNCSNKLGLPSKIEFVNKINTL